MKFPLNVFTKIHFEGLGDKLEYQGGVIEGVMHFTINNLPGVDIFECRQRPVDACRAGFTLQSGAIKNLPDTPALVEIFEMVFEDGTKKYRIYLGDPISNIFTPNFALFFYLDDGEMRIIHDPLIFYSQGPTTEDGFSTAPFFLLAKVAK